MYKNKHFKFFFVYTTEMTVFNVFFIGKLPWSFRGQYPPFFHVSYSFSMICIEIYSQNWWWVNILYITKFCNRIAKIKWVLNIWHLALFQLTWRVCNIHPKMPKWPFGGHYLNSNKKYVQKRTFFNLFLKKLGCLVIFIFKTKITMETLKL